MSKHTQTRAIRQRMAKTGENYTTARRATDPHSDSPAGVPFDLEIDSPEQSWYDPLGQRNIPTAAPFLAQAVRSTTSEVLQAVHDLYLSLYHQDDLRSQFATAYGDGNIYQARATRSAGMQMTGITGPKPSGHGRWKTGRNGAGWQPAANNPLCAEFERLARPVKVPVPGMPTSILLPPRFYTPVPFVHDGAVWVIVSSDPLPEHFESDPVRHGFASQWEPVPLSAAWAAREALEAGAVPVPGVAAPVTDAERDRARQVYEESCR